MELLWRIVYIILIGAFVWFLHKGIGHYPTPLPRSEALRKELGQVLLLWGMAVVVPILRLFIITPWLIGLGIDRTLQELIYLPLLTLLYLVFPLYIELKANRRSVNELGLIFQIRSVDVTLAAISFGLASGVIAYANNQAVIGMEVLPAGALVLLLYNNDFLEEFFHRGVIQTKLERAIGQGKAILFGGILFGLTHVVFDIKMLMDAQGFWFVFFAFVMQVLAGWLLGIVFVKTRSLWPGVACHYLANWLPSILVGVAG